MKARLMYRDRDFEIQQGLRPHDRDLAQDLELETLFAAMADGQQTLKEVAEKALLGAIPNDVDTILYRQEILKDCFDNEAMVREIHDLATRALEGKKKRYWSALGRYPAGILYDAIEVMQLLQGALRALRGHAETHGPHFHSQGFTTLFEMLKAELGDDYLATIEDQLRRLKFRGGVLVSAALGPANASADFVLRKPGGHEPTWFDRLVGRGPPAHTYHLPDRDEAGARILSDMNARAINLVANALAQSADHVLSFFEMLRTELAFYVGCLNLRAKLASLDAPVAFPEPRPAGSRAHDAGGLYDVSLALRLHQAPVGNALAADGKNLVIITGANQGGKSSLLRSVGLAQLMMQAGMFVGAERFTAEICAGVFTHFKREEDATMKSGKLEEELRRMSDIADALTPDSLALFNESFSSTNEREGSEIARQVVRALVEGGVKVFFVTHQYDFAHTLFEAKRRDALFLRAERRPDGARTFKLAPGEPLRTSYGEDLYRQVFAPDPRKSIAG